MPIEPEEHFSRYASTTKVCWMHTPAYLDFWVRHIARLLKLQPTDRLLDLGGGQGDFSQALIEHTRITTPATCVDPSSGYLAAANDRPGVEPVCQTAEDYMNPCPAGVFDKILIKQAVHFVPRDHRPTFWKQLHKALTPGGHVLVLTMPPEIEYPMFSAARDLFKKGQIHYSEIEEGLTKAGLRTETSRITYPVKISADDFHTSILQRYMSDLKDFSDEELSAGIREIQEACGSPDPYRFEDALYCVCGIKD